MSDLIATMPVSSTPHTRLVCLVLVENVHCQLLLSHVLGPMRMYGLDAEMKLASSALADIFYYPNLLIYVNVDDCEGFVSAGVVAVTMGDALLIGEASVLLVGDVLMSSEENELLVFTEVGELGRLLVN